MCSHRLHSAYHIRVCNHCDYSQEAAVEVLWDTAVVDPANSLINYEFYAGEYKGQHDRLVQWERQGDAIPMLSEAVS